MKGTLRTLKQFYDKYSNPGESRQHFVNRYGALPSIEALTKRKMLDFKPDYDVFTPTSERSVLRHLEADTSSVFTSGKTHIHLVPLRG